MGVKEVKHTWTREVVNSPKSLEEDFKLNCELNMEPVTFFRMW